MESTGLDVEWQVSELIRRLITPLSAKGLHSNNYDLPRYAEAAPEVFLEVLEADLATAEPVIFELLRPVDSSILAVIAQELDCCGD